MLIINRTEVERLLPMAACIDAMADAMRAASDGAVSMPLRLFTPLADDSGSLGLMPGSALDPPFFGAKVISLRFDNPAKGLPTVQGYVSLFDHDTGKPVALIEGSSVTAIRTAAASGLATRVLARQDVRTHGILGTGVQAVTIMRSNDVSPAGQPFVPSPTIAVTLRRFRAEMRCESCGASGVTLFVHHPNRLANAKRVTKGMGHVAQSGMEQKTMLLCRNCHMSHHHYHAKS